MRNLIKKILRESERWVTKQHANHEIQVGDIFMIPFIGKLLKVIDIEEDPDQIGVKRSATKWGVVEYMSKGVIVYYLTSDDNGITWEDEEDNSNYSDGEWIKILLDRGYWIPYDNDFNVDEFFPE